MITFTGKLILTGKEREEYFHYRVKAENADEAAAKLAKLAAIDEVHPLPRTMEVGDCAIISNPQTSFDGFYIYDKDLSPRRVDENNFIFWRLHLVDMPERNQGIDAAMDAFRRQHHEHQEKNGEVA